MTIYPPPGGVFGPVAPGGTLPVGVILTAIPGTTGRDVRLHNIVADDYVFASAVIRGAFAERTVAGGDCSEYVLQGAHNRRKCQPGGFGGGIGLLLLSTMLAGTRGCTGESAVGSVVWVVRADRAGRNGVDFAAAQPERRDAAGKLSAIYHGNVQWADGVRASGEFRR